MSDTSLFWRERKARGRWARGTERSVAMGGCVFWRKITPESTWGEMNMKTSHVTICDVTCGGKKVTRVRKRTQHVSDYVERFLLTLEFKISGEPGYLQILLIDRETNSAPFRAPDCCASRSGSRCSLTDLPALF